MKKKSQANKGRSNRETHKNKNTNINLKKEVYKKEENKITTVKFVEILLFRSQKQQQQQQQHQPQLQQLNIEFQYTHCIQCSWCPGTVSWVSFQMLIPLYTVRPSHASKHSY